MTQKENFSVFFDNITEIKIGLNYYTDFKKVMNNIKTISLRLTQLNYLVGQKDMRKAVEELWEENPKAFSVMGILVAVRKKQNKKAWGRDGSERRRKQQAEQRAENEQLSALQNFHHKLFPLPFQHEYDRQDILLGNGPRDRRHNGIVGERQFSIFRNRPR